MNPLLPRNFFIPDVEAHVMPDGRLYLYGSCDISGKKEYCGTEYRVFSTDDPQLSRWTDHGVSFRFMRRMRRLGTANIISTPAGRTRLRALPYPTGRTARFPRRSRLPALTGTASILRFLSMTTGRRIIYGDSFL